MKDIIIDILIRWSVEKNERTKLQHALFAIVFLLATIAGLVTLLSPYTGQIIIMIAALLAAVYLINGLVWVLLDGTVIKRIEAIKRSKSRKS